MPSHADSSHPQTLTGSKQSAPFGLRSLIARAWHTFEIDDRVATRSRLLVALVAALLHALLYGIPNRFLIFEPSQLPLTALDLAVPLLPVTAWIYWSEYVLVFVAFRKTDQPVLFIRAFAITLVAAVLMHLLLPTTYPRDLFPIASTDGSFSAALLLRFRALDGAASCFPSLHVAIATVAALSVRKTKAGLPVMLWAVLIAVSTLTTKQHYAYDVVGGALLGLGGWAIAARLGHPHAPRAHSAAA